MTMQIKKIFVSCFVIYSTVLGAANAAQPEKQSAPPAAQECKKPEDAKVSRSKTGILYRHLFSGNQFQVGVQGSQFIKESIFHMGVEVDYQTGYSSASTYAIAAQFFFGAEKVQNGLLYGGTLGLGAAQFYGVTSGANTSFLIQPEAYLGLVLGMGWRVSATTSYSGYAAQSGFSSAAIGLRFDYKIETTVVELND